MNLDLWPSLTTPSTNFPAYTRAAVGEAFPLPMHPLIWDMLGKPNEGALRKSYQMLGLYTAEDYTDNEHQMNAYFGGYCYISLTAAATFAEASPVTSVEQLEQLWFGTASGSLGAGVVRLKQGARERVAQRYSEATASDEFEDLSGPVDPIIQLRESRGDLSTASHEFLVDRLEQVAYWDGELTGDLQYCNQMSVATQSFLRRALVEAGEPEELAGDLLTFGAPFHSALASLRLTELAEALTPDQRARILSWPVNEDLTLERIRSLDPEVAAQFDSVLAEFGHCGPGGLELLAPSWSTNPEYIVLDLQQMLSAPERVQGDDSDRQARLQELLAVPTLAEATRIARRYVAGREALRDAVAIDLNEGRLCVRELAKRLIEADYIEQGSDVVMLPLADLRGIYEQDPAKVREVIAGRQEIYQAFCSKEPPFVVNGELSDWQTWPDRDRVIKAAASGSVIVGIPGSPGVATAVARVVESPSELGDFQPGDILVAPHTNPAWSALMTSASGIVVEVGGELSHTSIVAKALGIPAVLSVMDATRLLAYGQVITLDGTRGEIAVQ